MISRIRPLMFGLLMGIAGACAGYSVVGEFSFVDREPPPLRREVIVAAPGPGYAWVAGHWVWSVSDYVWAPGVWVQVQPGFRRWEPGRWRHDRRGWRWEEGHWR